MRELKLPLSLEDVKGLMIGESVKLTGRIFTARDEAHMRALEFHKEGKELPFDLNGSAIFHCGPIMRRSGEKWAVVAAGPTTSFRMSTLEPEVIESFGVRAIIGKGGMSRQTIDAMERFGCVYLALTGGAAVIAAKGIEDVRGVHWDDLGMAEAVWELDVSHFGPLTVAIDAHGNSLYEKVGEYIDKRLPFIKSKLGID